MPVPPEHIDAIAATVADIYREAETALVRIIARHLKGDMDRDMQSPAWAEKKLAAVGALRRAARAVIAALQADGSKAMAEAAAEAFRAGDRSALAELPKEWFERSGIGQAAQAAEEELPGFAAVEAMAAAVHQDVGEKSANILRDVLDVYRSVITATVARTLTGVQTRQEASQAAWQRFMDRGITGFTDRAGRRWALSTYVEMAARAVTQRAAVTGQTDRLQALGQSLVICSDHGQECSLCRPFEGRVLSLDGQSGDRTVSHQLTDEPMTVHVTATLDEARLRGFQHPNCRHSVSIYLPGVTKLPDRKTADPEGDKARQRQRAIEREIRKAKVAEQGALTSEARKDARAKVRAWQGAMRDHLKANPTLKRLPYRESIGAGNIPPKGRDDAAGDIGLTVQPALDGGPSTILRRPPRDEDQASIVPTAEPDPDQLDLLNQPADPLAGIDLTLLPDEELEDLVGAVADDADALDRALAEIDRRQAEEEAAAARRERDQERREQSKRKREEEQWARFEQLLEQGHDEESAVEEVFGVSIEQQRRDRAIAQLRGQGYTGKGLDELARKAYRDYVYEQYINAENATRGHLLTPEAQRAGIDPLTLFSGPVSRARKYASDELKGYWEEHGRLTYDEWVARLLGDNPESGTTGDAFR